MWAGVAALVIVVAGPMAGMAAAALEERDWKNAVNLLPLIDPERDANKGRWTLQDAELVSDSKTVACIRIPYEPPSEYDFRLVFARTRGHMGVYQIFSRGDRCSAWMIDGGGGAFGFEVDGKNTYRNATTIRTGQPLQNGRIHTSVLQVRQDGIAAYLDGRLISRWVTDYRDVKINRGWAGANPRLLGIACWEIEARFHKIDVLEITGKGKALVRASDKENLNDVSSTAASKLVTDYRNGLAFFESSVGAGSGFIADYKGQKFLFSNAHVLAANKGAVFTLLDRTPVSVSGGSVAVGHDIVALRVASGGASIPMAETVEKTAAIGDPVAVLGNAQGGGVINTLTGRIVGIGPDRIEIDAPFQLGNSGSPVIHLSSGKVIGIATYITSRQKFGEKQVTVRRFGYRLDSVQQWQPIDWNRFYGEAGTMSRIEGTTEELIQVFLELARTGHVSGNYKTTAIGYAVDSFKRSRDSRNDPKPLLSALCSICMADVQAAGPKLSYDYFRRDLARQRTARDELVNAFKKLSK
jgi:S1-C subfamily serine protease